MKYIFDFDRTLFDTEALKREISRRRLSKLQGKPEVWDFISPADFLYEDTTHYLQKNNFQKCSVLTMYEPRLGPHAEAYQTRKVHDSGITQYVDQVVVMRGLKGPYVSKMSREDPVVFVDDSVEQLTSAAHMCPQALCVQMVRSGTERQETFPVITSLEELDTIIDT